MSGSGETTVDDLLAEITAREATARVLLRQDLIERHRGLVAELEEAAQSDGNENRKPQAPVIARQVADLEAEIGLAKRAFRFRAIGRRPWLNLLAKHPPTKEQIKVADPRVRLDHNPDTFPIAAIAASCVEPKMTVEQVAKFDELIDLTEWNKIWGACLDANTGGDTDPKDHLHGRILRVSAAFGITPAELPISHGASSSAE